MMTITPLQPVPLSSVTLLPGVLEQRYELNRAYMMSLSSAALLQNYYNEAGLTNVPRKPDDYHWGWESPTCQLRGHFLGHWLSAAAYMAAAHGDGEIKAKADAIVAELGRCQKANGGEWAGSIPEKYFDRIANGQQIWAPHYTVHKTLLGLYDMYALAGNQQALDILINWARWFSRWSAQFSREQFDDILDVETGGMLEVWANLYGVTGSPEHLELLSRYDRPRLFEPLLRGEDVLTNQHANTTIPEILGCARAWEVTGEERYRRIVEAYWKSAVTERGFYATGGQTCGEVWTPPHELSARLGDKNQEHCTVFSMMLLAEKLLRWTGDLTYADYWERNLYNGILAQQHPQTGMIAYFLPLEAGAVKRWGSPTEDFWCCHGTLVQAHAMHGSGIYYETGGGLTIAQYLPTELTLLREGSRLRISQRPDGQSGARRRPGSAAFEISVASDRPAELTLTLRLPWWLAGSPTITVNGEPVDVPAGTSSVELRRTWTSDTIRLELPRRLSAVELPDAPGSVAFMDGPVVLAGLTDEEHVLIGDPNDPSTLLTADNEREWGSWMSGYRTYNQQRNFRFLPLYQIREQRYTVYFPVRDAR